MQMVTGVSLVPGCPRRGTPSHTHPHQMPVGMGVVLSSATTAVGRRRAGGRQGSLGFLPLKSKALSSEHFNPLSEKQFEATKGGVLTKTTR